MGDKKECEFGLVIDAADVVMAIVNGKMTKFVEMYNPTDVLQSEDGQTQVLLFDCDSKEHLMSIHDSAIEDFGLSSTRILECGATLASDKIIPFTELEKRRGK